MSLCRTLSALKYYPAFEYLSAPECCLHRRPLGSE